jgi:hypothetical protein
MNNQTDIFHITQSILAIILILALAALVIRGIPIPPDIMGFIGVIIGFYFGFQSAKTG